MEHTSNKTSPEGDDLELDALANGKPVDRVSNDRRDTMLAKRAALPPPKYLVGEYEEVVRRSEVKRLSRKRT